VLKAERQDQKMQCLTFVSAHPIIDAGGITKKGDFKTLWDSVFVRC